MTMTMKLLIGGAVGSMGLMMGLSGPSAEASVAAASTAEVTAASIDVSTSVSGGTVTVSATGTNASCSRTGGNDWCCRVDAGVTMATVTFGPTGFVYLQRIFNSTGVIIGVDTFTSWFINSFPGPSSRDYGVVYWDGSQIKTLPDPTITVQTTTCGGNGDDRHR
jgi:hypothetical protein